ncbi:MAG: response regulator transcription factor [Deltaproteobacteria bacterium]|nr:response regulator transcription factor [Deltaproteobacteria bacterium]
MTLKIILADDHAIIRDGLRALLEKDPHMEVVEEAEDGRVAVQQAKELSPDVVVMDIAMPNLNGTEATRQIKARSPKIKVIALSMHSDKRFVAEMLTAGASGYVLKNSAFKEMIQAINAVVQHGTYLSPMAARPIVEACLEVWSKGESPFASPLTPREREVLQLLSEGNSSKEAAFILNLSVKTVDTHRYRIMKKLNFRSLAELTKYAIKEGITSLDI